MRLAAKNGRWYIRKTKGEWRSMSYSVSEQRIQTMLERVGSAAELIDDRQYLPFYRSIQIKLEKMGKSDEWAKMIELAKKAKNPSRYFSSLCKAIKNETYKFFEKAKELTKQLTNDASLYLSDKIVRFGFGEYQKYWVRKSQEFINLNGMAGFVELLEYAERKGISQKYFAQALLNGKPPRKYYQENVRGGHYESA